MTEETPEVRSDKRRRGEREEREEREERDERDQNGDLTKLLKSARKKVPPGARLSAGGGVQKL